ncbi:hypothetical protein BH23GEM9_BH23GEM9_11790 [soil metagenome]
MKRITLRRRRRRGGPRETARRLLRQLPHLFKLVFRLLRDPHVPRFDKLLLGAVAVYMVTPLDLVPDFLGPLGWVDDFYLLGLALSRLMVSAGPDRLVDHWDGDPRELGYFVEGVEDLGADLPSRVRRGLKSIISEPRQLRSRKRRVRRIRVDDDARVHLEE